MKKKILNVITIIAILIFIWLIASFIDTNICNDPLSPRYQDVANWNIFSILFK